MAVSVVRPPCRLSSCGTSTTYLRYLIRLRAPKSGWKMLFGECAARCWLKFCAILARSSVSALRWRRDYEALAETVNSLKKQVEEQESAIGDQERAYHVRMLSGCMRCSVTIGPSPVPVLPAAFEWQPLPARCNCGRVFVHGVPGCHEAGGGRGRAARQRRCGATAAHFSSQTVKMAESHTECNGFSCLCPLLLSPAEVQAVALVDCVRPGRSRGGVFSSASSHGSGSMPRRTPCITPSGMVCTAACVACQR